MTAQIHGTATTMLLDLIVHPKSTQAEWCTSLLQSIVSAVPDDQDVVQTIVALAASCDPGYTSLPDENREAIILRSVAILASLASNPPSLPRPSRLAEVVDNPSEKTVAALFESILLELTDKTAETGVAVPVETRNIVQQYAAFMQKPGRSTLGVSFREATTYLLTEFFESKRDLGDVTFVPTDTQMVTIRVNLPRSTYEQLRLYAKRRHLPIYAVVNSILRLQVMAKIAA